MSYGCPLCDWFPQERFEFPDVIKKIVLDWHVDAKHPGWSITSRER